MYFLIRFSSYLMLSIFIVSCASTDKQEVYDPYADESASYKYQAWRLTDAEEFEAINVLLAEVDVLIENNSFNAATDKLERVLRIKADYAPAWSRLSWIALQTDVPKRSVEMAKRSNSFAQGDAGLQRLNWSFISTASKALNDEDMYQRANQKIDSLTSF